VPDLIRTWVPRRYVTLGTDGFGRSDTRTNLRRWFEVDRTSIAFAAIKALADDGETVKTIPQEFLARYGYHPPIEPPWADGRETT
jgi:pyruvate dehydrogenase E1 component